VDSVQPEFLKMTRDELLNMHELLCEESRNLMRKKNADYAGNDGLEPFANFTRVEAMGICKTEQGFLVRMTDKMSRLSSFVESGKLAVEDESLKDTIVDVINYSVLLYSYVQEKKKTNNTQIKSSKICCKDSNRVIENRPVQTFYIHSPIKDSTNKA